MIEECTVHRQELVVVHQHCRDKPYLELTIPEGTGRILSLNFTFESRDQGIDGMLSIASVKD